MSVIPGSLGGDASISIVSRGHPLAFSWLAIKRWSTADSVGHASAAVRSTPKLDHTATDPSSSAGRSGECNNGEAWCIRVAPVDSPCEPQMGEPNSAPILPSRNVRHIQEHMLHLHRCPEAVPVRHADSFPCHAFVDETAHWKR